MFTLYHSPGSCSLAIKAALALSNASFDTQIIKLSAGEHLQPEYLKINPFGKVPALRKNDFVMTEGLAIHLYLADQFPESGLLPQTEQARAESYRWLAYLYTTIHSTFGRLFMPERYGNDAADVRTKAEASLFDQLTLIDQQLSKQDYLAGDQVSAPDLYLLVALHWQGVLEKNLLTTFPSFKRFTDRLLAHPTVGKVFREELLQDEAA